IPATLSEVLSQSDFVSMHAPARPEVHHMLGEKHFKQMKKTAVFVNTGRGATVDEEGLIKALQEGWIAHAALDVLETEPPSHNNPLLRMENVTLTAHVASASARFDEARKRRVGFELSLVLQGFWPKSCVNPSVLQTTSLKRWQPVGMDRGPNSSAEELMAETKTGLVVTAHPGDFVWRAAGAIALHAKRGYRVKIVCMSFGERGESQFAWKEAGATLASVKAGREAAWRRDRILRLRRLSAEAERPAFRPHGRHLPGDQSKLRVDPRAGGPLQFRPS